MLSPFAIQHLLKHFDSIDRVVSLLLTDARPKNEEYLTANLVDCFDPKMAQRVGLEYGIDQLNADLTEAGEPLSVDYRIEVHQYTKEYESLVSQADLGLVIKYVDNYNPKFSTRRSWLLQAKRLYPDSPSFSYSVDSKFMAMNTKQEAQISELMNAITTDFFRYLLYCPRPEHTPTETRMELAYLRGSTLGGEIFDFAYGLELRDDLRCGAPTVAAGIFLSPVDAKPSNLGETHKNLFSTTTPLSWFLIQHIPHAGRYTPHRGHFRYYDPHDHNEIIERIVQGDATVANDIAKHLKNEAWNGRVLPAATLELTISMGPRNARERRRKD